LGQEAASFQERSSAQVPSTGESVSFSRPAGQSGGGARGSSPGRPGNEHRHKKKHKNRPSSNSLGEDAVQKPVPVDKPRSGAAESTPRRFPPRRNQGPNGNEGNK